MNLNHVMIAGRLTRDVQVKQLQGGKTIAEFGLATGEKWTDKQTGEQKETTCFVDCVAFAGRAEFIAKHFSKGKAIFVIGKLKFDSWDAKDGSGKRSKLSVVVDDVKFVGPPDGNGSGQTYDRSTSQEQPRQGYRPRTNNLPMDPTKQPDDGKPFAEDDIPF